MSARFSGASGHNRADGRRREVRGRSGAIEMHRGGTPAAAAETGQYLVHGSRPPPVNSLRDVFIISNRRGDCQCRETDSFLPSRAQLFEQINGDPLPFLPRLAAGAETVYNEAVDPPAERRGLSLWKKNGFFIFFILMKVIQKAQHSAEPFNLFLVFRIPPCAHRSA